MLRSFSGPPYDGEQPLSTLVLSNGFLYGTTYNGGPYNTTTQNAFPDGDGVIFKIDTSGNNFQVLHYFNFPEGKGPYSSPILASNGLLYGTTYQGGALAPSGSYHGGVVYQLDTSGNNFRVLHSFDSTDTTGLTNLAGSLSLDSQGNLYGTTYSDVFKMDMSGNNFQVLHHFTGSDGDGVSIATPILENSGYLYGVGFNGGAYGKGVVFKIGTSGTNFQTLHDFNGTDGSTPYGAMTLDAPGKLYGTTESGGTYGNGVVFNIDTSGNNFQVLHHFNGPDGANPTAFDVGPLLAQGNLYGTTSGGGTYGNGVVWQLAFPTYAICPLYDQTKAVRSGATIPIKLQVCDANGGNLSSPSLVVTTTAVTRISNNAPGTLEDSGNANPDNNFRYDATLGGTGGYIFNLSTKGFVSGTFRLSFTAGSDPTVYGVEFQIR